MSKISSEASIRKQTLEFFHTLDTYISDDEVATYMRNTDSKSWSVALLRNDQPTTNNSKKMIAENFPNGGNWMNVVPNILS